MLLLGGHGKALRTVKNLTYWDFPFNFIYATDWGFPLDFSIFLAWQINRALNYGAWFSPCAAEIGLIGGGAFEWLVFGLFCDTWRNSSLFRVLISVNLVLGEKVRHYLSSYIHVDSMETQIKWRLMKVSKGNHRTDIKCNIDSGPLVTISFHRFW